MKKREHLILIISILLITISLVMISFSLYQQYEVIKKQNELKRLYLLQTNEKVIIQQEIIKNNQKFIENYIINQKYLLDNWWNTIINQSGLSIIVTIIVLLITITVGLLNKNNLDSTISREIKIFRKDYKDIISDITIIFTSHRGTFGMRFTSSEANYNNCLRCLNSFSKLKKLTKNNFIDLYENDIKEMSSRIHDRIKSIEYIKITTEIYNLINQIIDTEDRKNVLRKFIKNKKTMQKSYPEDSEKERKLKEDNDLIDSLINNYNL